MNDMIHQFALISGKKHVLLSLLLLACCQGCSDPQRLKLVGKWELEQPELVVNRLGSTGQPDADPDSTRDSEFGSAMTLEFRADETFQTQTAMGKVKREKNGTWEVISFDEAGGKMTIRCKIGSQETDHPIEFVEKSSIRLLPPNLAGLSMKMRFRRAD